MITYPLNKIEYQATDAELFHCTRNSGIYSSEDFRPSVSGVDNIVNISEGIGWIRNSRFSGKVVCEKITTSVDLGLADASLPRWDVVCLQFDKSKNATEIVVKNGTPASSPLLPEISQTETLYELYICKVYRKAGAVSVTAVDVTDLRLDPIYCGLMADSVTEIDTTGINAQINALIEELREEIAGVETSAEIMLKSVYDTNNDGVVDNAEKLGGNLPSYYATADNAMPKSGGEFAGNVEVRRGRYFDIKTANGYRLRFVGDRNQDVALIQVAGPDGNWIAGVMDIDITTGNAKAATVPGNIEGIRNNIFYTSAGVAVSDNIKVIEFYDK